METDAGGGVRSPLAGWIAATLAVGAFIVAGLRLDAALVSLPEGLSAEELAPGELAFRRDCAGCHVLPSGQASSARSAARVLGTPNRAGPTVERVVAGYMEAYAARDSAEAAMVAFVRKPVRDASLLPDTPDDTWDRMAPLAISRDDLAAAVEWMIDRGMRAASDSTDAAAADSVTTRSDAGAGPGAAGS